MSIPRKTLIGITILIAITLAYLWWQYLVILPYPELLRYNIGISVILTALNVTVGIIMVYLVYKQSYIMAGSVQEMQLQSVLMEKSLSEMRKTRIIGIMRKVLAVLGLLQDRIRENINLLKKEEYHKVGFVKLWEGIFFRGRYTTIDEDKSVPMVHFEDLSWIGEEYVVRTKVEEILRNSGINLDEYNSLIGRLHHKNNGEFQVVARELLSLSEKYVTLIDEQIRSISKQITD